MNSPDIIRDEIIRHPSETRGVRITRVQHVRVGDAVTVVEHWTQFETGSVVRLTSHPLAERAS